MSAGPNPYEPPQTAGETRPHFGDHCRLIKAGFLYRKIEFVQPFPAIFVYNGWNFLQRIYFNETLVWSRISWAIIHRKAEFQLPAEVDPERRRGSVAIAFDRGLRIRRFILTIGEEVVYSEAYGS